MKIYQRACSIFVFLFSIITICLGILSFFNYVKVDFITLFLGFTELFSGLNQIARAQQKDEQGIHKGNKPLGIITVILGIVLIATCLIKITA